MKIAIYTSLAINYLAKARVLAQTVKAHNSEIDVIALVSDRFPGNIDPTKEPFDDIWMVEEYPTENIHRWIFRHNIMELSTAVKGWALLRLLEAGYDYVMYLDPDCWVMEDPALIINELTPEYSVGIVPHTMKQATSEEEIRIVETSSLKHGIYNLGFLIVRNDDAGLQLARWWAERLDKYCLDDFKTGLFTDQRWFDLAVGYFSFIKIIRHNGIDVASWNIGQRTIERHGDGYLVDNDPLIFYHFSGVGPNGVHRWVRDKFAPSDPLAAEIEFRYEKLLADQGQATLQKITPYFDLYGDGEKIEHAHRVAFRENIQAFENFGNPYDPAIGRSIRSEMRKYINQDDNSKSIAVTNNAAISTGVSTMEQSKIDELAMCLFDAEFFKIKSKSAETDKIKLWQEFVARGWDDDANGNRMFDVQYYKLMIIDQSTTSSPTPFHHYVEFGIKAKVSPCWIYDDSYYLSNNPDIAEAVRRGDISFGFEHFSLYGASEGRSGCAYFNERRYLELHSDVANEVASGAMKSGCSHYVMFGRSEGRAIR